MKIVCIAYRDWAKEIYSNIQKNSKNHSFLNLDHKISNLEKKIKNFNPDLILWYGWSEKINEKFVNKYFSVMLHPSPLPKYRGGSPIQNQIINGESKSAVTLFKINNKIDQGDIIYQKEFLLDGSLKNILNKITDIGTDLTNKMLINFPNLKLIKQDNSSATFFKRRTPSESEITIEEIKNSSSKQLYDKIRALQDPYPNAYIIDSKGNKLYITKAHL